ncbi:hypothetical protein ACFPM0_22290 [Pseudonocardia sulfidoxydans]|uniref:hypothetical protein n=1 Tax=Pseudonocardia sulfidoxydans TaxID=54011 RepID=UPI00360C4013
MAPRHADPGAEGAPARGAADVLTQARNLTAVSAARKSSEVARGFVCATVGTCTDDRAPRARG